MSIELLLPMNNSQQVVTSYLDAFRRMDIDAVIALYAENGVYDNPVKGGLNTPPGGIKGHEALKQAFAVLPKAFVRNDVIDNRIYTTPDDERLVMVENTCDCEFHNGTFYRNFVMYRFVVEGGKIRQLIGYVIDPDVQKAAWQQGMPGFTMPA